MSRSGYSEDCEGWKLIMWRGAVASATRGRRGQSILKEMLAALDAMLEKRLIASKLELGGKGCALGAVGKARGVDLRNVDPEDRYRVAQLFNIAPTLAAEIVYENDEGAGYWRKETPEQRFERMRKWVVSHIRE
jgi:hypothetical protein